MNAPIMRQISRFNLVPFAVCLSLGVTPLLEAQSVKKPNPALAGSKPVSKPADAKAGAEIALPRHAAADRKDRPPEDDLVIDKLSPELEKILVDWESHSSKFKSLHGKHIRREFIKAFAVEKVSSGEFFLELPDKGRIDMKAIVPKKGDVSTRLDGERNPYKLEKGPSESWICNGEEIFSFNDDQMTYSRDELPTEMRGKNIVHSPLPFLFGMKAEEAKRRYSMTLLAATKNSPPNTVRLKAIPRMDSDRQNYHEAWIILDTKRYIPTHVRLFDPNGLETNYEFNSVEINNAGIFKAWKEKFRDPYNPSVRGYTRALPNDVEQTSGKSADGTNPTKTPIGSATQKRGAADNSSGRPQLQARSPGPASQPSKK